MPGPRLGGMPRTILALGVASFLTDLSSEMIFPLLPAFFAASLGAGPAALGIVEGVAEATASVMKIVSGWWTDATARRKRLIVGGYAISGVSRPLIGLAGSWIAVLLLRFMDRVGKGIRTSPRDALIADTVEPARLGAAYGLHRAMDHAGAVVGPLVGAALLGWGGLDMRTVFLLAAIPAALAVVVLAKGVDEPKPKREARPFRLRDARADWKHFGRDFRLVIAAVGVFTLGGATDAFLLMRLNDVGISPAMVAVLWSLHHVVKAASTYAFGAMTDRVGPRPLVLGGWALYAAVYAAFALWDGPTVLAAIFLVYGLYFGMTEPSEKAWIASMAPERLRGTAFGCYHGVVGLGAMPASILFGLLWNAYGAAVPFLVGAGFSAVGAAMLMATKPPKPA